MTNELFDFEKELLSDCKPDREEKVNPKEMEEAKAKLIDALLAAKLEYDDYKFIFDFREAAESITRGLRDRSPTTRTISARYAQTSGARDAQRAGCLAGLPALSRS